MMSATRRRQWWLPLYGWLVAVFVSITAYYIVCHHVVPLSRDQWHMYHALFEQGVWKTAIGTVSGHRHILAFLLYDIDLRFFEGNNHFLIAVDWLLNGTLIALLCVLVRRGVTDSVSRWLLCGWVVVLLTWLLNIALLGWGFNGINNYMAIVNIALSALFLHHAVHDSEQRHAFACALLCAALATFSFGNGVLVWIIGFLLLVMWRTPRYFFARWSFAAALLFALYFVLPGGEASGQMLRFPGWQLLEFPLQVMGAPLYHLLRAWRVVPESGLTVIANGMGALVIVLVLRHCLHAAWRAQRIDSLDSVAFALVFTGLGSTAMLTMARVDGLLDFHVDRFQIWALLVWTGLSLLLYRGSSPGQQRLWQVLMVSFPLLALPSQLDWGARLAEYRTRVNNALLAYQVYLPVAEDAEKALHWNWQKKLPHLITVMEILRTEQRNVFAGGAAVRLGQTMVLPDGLRACAVSGSQLQPVKKEALLALDDIPAALSYRVVAGDGETVGWRWYLTVQESPWDGGVMLDDQGVVRGLIQPVSHSFLPRASGLVRDEYNAVGMARQPGSPVGVLLWRGEMLCRLP